MRVDTNHVQVVLVLRISWQLSRARQTVLL
jgi:hypothetical protein